MSTDNPTGAIIMIPLSNGGTVRIGHSQTVADVYDYMASCDYNNIIIIIMKHTWGDGL